MCWLNSTQKADERFYTEGTVKSVHFDMINCPRISFVILPDSQYVMKTETGENRVLFCRAAGKDAKLVNAQNGLLNCNLRICPKKWTVNTQTFNCPKYIFADVLIRYLDTRRKIRIFCTTVEETPIQISRFDFL